MGWVHETWVWEEVARVAPQVTFKSSELFDHGRRFEIAVTFPGNVKYRVGSVRTTRGDNWKIAPEAEVREGTRQVMYDLVSKYGKSHDHVCVH